MLLGEEKVQLFPWRVRNPWRRIRDSATQFGDGFDELTEHFQWQWEDPAGTASSAQCSLTVCTCWMCPSFLNFLGGISVPLPLISAPSRPLELLIAVDEP